MKSKSWIGEQKPEIDEVEVIIETEDGKKVDTITVPKWSILWNVTWWLTAHVATLVCHALMIPAVITAGQKIDTGNWIIDTGLRIKNGFIAWVDLVSLWNSTNQKLDLLKSLEGKSSADEINIWQLKKFFDIIWPTVDQAIKAGKSLTSPEAIEAATAMWVLFIFFSIILPQFIKALITQDKIGIIDKLRIYPVQWVKEKIRK